ncbi:hypothetical protein B4113_2894 [Geobacillus sp. B4113_201601]|nr:hypothetical protein B4113_2894 [Geobacillus sp. B4113_201601]
MKKQTDATRFFSLRNEMEKHEYITGLLGDRSLKGASR